MEEKKGFSGFETIIGIQMGRQNSSASFLNMKFSRGLFYYEYIGYLCLAK